MGLTPATSDLPQPGFGGERGSGDLFLAALAGSGLAPFVQAVVTKFGDDVYAKIKALLARRGSPDASLPTGTGLTLMDSERALILQLPSVFTADDAAQLAELRLPVAPAGEWVFVHIDPVSSRWRATIVEQPPPGAVEV